MSAPLPSPLHLDQRPVVAIFRSPVFNASETFVPAQAAALARYQPLVVGLERKGHIPPTLAARLILAEGLGEALKLKLLGRGAGIADRLAALSPALVHAHFGPDGLLSLPIARRLGIPLVTTLHGYDVNRSRAALLGSGRLSWIRYAAFQNRLIAQGDLFIAVSDAIRRQAIRRGFPEARTVTHRIGVDLGRFPVGAGGEATILHVGRLVEKKGTHILLRAFALIRARIPEARLVIAGDGPRRAALERLAGELGLGDSVRFLGMQPPDSIAEWMRRSTALALPSVTARDGDAEGLPVVLFEAAASGLPVVGSDHSGIPEGITEGETGFVVPDGAVEPLADRLALLLGSPDLAGRMRMEARSLAEREFDLARQTETLERIYDQVRASASP